MISLGPVTRLDAVNGVVWVELSRIARGFMVGPLVVHGTMPTAVGELVVVADLDGQGGQYVCLGAAGAGQDVDPPDNDTPPLEVIPFTIPGPLSVASPSTLLIPMMADCTFLSLQIILAGAPTGSSVNFDVLYNGQAQNPGAAMTSIYGATKPSIASGGQGYWNAVAPVTTDFIADSLLRVDLTQVGSGSPGSGLSGFLRLQHVTP